MIGIALRRTVILQIYRGNPVSARRRAPLRGQNRSPGILAKLRQNGYLDRPPAVCSCGWPYSLFVR